MGDYNLHGLTTRDFQHLVQGVARSVISSGVTAMGDGKDGNRDLVYRGASKYPTVDAAWNGYIVLACKFKQTPQDARKDAAWAISQLKSDLKKFSDKRRALHTPEYFIYVTNVALTPVPTTGGRARLEKVLSEFQVTLGFKDFAVWDYHDIRGFLDNNLDVRQAYGHLITAGDVLAQAVQCLAVKPTFLDVMHRFLQKELITDMTAKLQSASDDPESQVELSNVFVDLPFAFAPDGLAPDHERKRGNGIVKYLVESGSSYSLAPPLAQPDPTKGS